MSQDINQYHNVLASKARSNQLQSSEQQFKLPKLVPPSSRGRILSRKQNKASVYLPNIAQVQDEEYNQNFRNTQTINIGRRENDISKSQSDTIRDDFISQVGQKTESIRIKNQNKANQDHDQDEYYKNDDLSDDLDFQEKINQNKEIIKSHRKNNDIFQKKSHLERPVQLLQKINSKNKTKTMKPQSNYEKKMKQYNNSLQNKFLQRKKQSLGIIPQKAQKQAQKVKSKNIISMKDAIDQVKVNFGYKQFKSNGQMNKSQTKQSDRPNKALNDNKVTKREGANSVKNVAKQSRRTQQNSPSNKIRRTSALFDNIQSLLQNPLAGLKNQNFYRQLAKKLRKKDVNKLQQQIKQINDKIGINDYTETKSTVAKQGNNSPFLITQGPLLRTVRDWKRIQLNDKHNLHYHQSNFQKELDYISYLQQKNSSSLLKFVDHQKIMLQLQMSKRLQKSVAKKAFSQPNS